MKIYKQSFWRAGSTKYFVFPLLFFIVLFCVLPQYYTNFLTPSVIFSWGMIAIYLFMFVIILAMLTQYFYITISEDKILIKNAIFTFWKTEVELTQVSTCILGRIDGMTRNYFQIKYNGKSSPRYIINLVDWRDYDDLIAELQSRGIEVAIVGNLVKR